MKQKLFVSAVTFVLSLGLLPVALSAQVAQGDIDLQQVSQVPTNPTGICQCDTITIRYEIKPGSSFSPTTDFEYQFANPINTWGSATNLQLVELLTQLNPPVNANTVQDTFNSGLKWAVLAVPCNAPLFGTSFRILNRAANGNPSPDGISDTAFYNINRIPAVADIDSIALISGGARLDTFENPYTVTQQDVGFCPGDSVVLYATGDGSSYRWYNGTGPLVNGGTDDSLIVTQSGNYRCEIIDGPCSIFTNTVNVTEVDLPTEVAFDVNDPRNGGAYQADNPRPIGAPLDSVQLCENSSVILNLQQAPPGSGVTFSYQWLTDSFNTTTGQRDIYPINGATSRELVVDASTARKGFNQYYGVVSDGTCQDTTERPYKVILDSIPSPQTITIPTPNQTSVDTGTTCMVDSVELTTTPSLSDPNWKYRWEWYNPSNQNWLPVSGATTPNQRSFDTLPSIMIDTSLSDQGQPYFQTPKPLIRYFRVRISTQVAFRQTETCVGYSDTMIVRWQPGEDIIQLAPNQQQVTQVGNDSASFCITDSAVLQGPNSPVGIDTAGFPYTYQWLTDSLNPNTNNRVIYPIAGATNRQFTADSTGRFWLILDDGICRDTSNVFRTFADSVAETTIQEVPFAGGSGTTGLNLCLYDSAQVTATDTVQGISPWDYQWQQYNPISASWSDLTGEDDFAIKLDTSFQRSNEDTAYFRLRTSYTNIFGVTTCEHITDSVQVIYFEDPDVNFIPGDSVGVCPGDSILFVAQGNFSNFSWQNGQRIGASTYISQPGTYATEAVGQNGCISFDTVEVFPFVVNANAGPDVTAGSGEVVQLDATGGTSYRWFASEPIQFSDMNSQRISVSKELPEGVSNDTVTIFVEVTSQRGCTGLDSLQFFIERNVPGDVGLIDKAYNIMTPNGDGLNDEWDIRELMDGDDCRITILNRWGSPVFESDNFSGVWTGVDNGGNALPDGTYYYVLDCDGEIRMRNAITIIRNQ